MLMQPVIMSIHKLVSHKNVQLQTRVQVQDKNNKNTQE